MPNNSPNSICQYRGFIISVERYEDQAIVYRQVARQGAVQSHHFSLEWTDAQLFTFALARIDEVWHTWERYRRAIWGR